jgi:hypothetical protein
MSVMRLDAGYIADLAVEKIGPRSRVTTAQARGRRRELFALSGEILGTSAGTGRVRS